MALLESCPPVHDPGPLCKGWFTMQGPFIEVSSLQQDHDMGPLVCRNVRHADKLKLGREREQQQAKRTLCSWSVGAPVGSGRGQAAGRRRKHQASARPKAQSSCPAALGRHTWPPRKCHVVSASMPRAHMVTCHQGVSNSHTSNFVAFERLPSGGVTTKRCSRDILLVSIVL